MSFESGRALTHETARNALATGLAQIRAGALRLDCGALAQFDSSALAVFLAWQRAAQARGGQLEIVNVPSGLRSLARVYGLDSILPL